jgi:glucose-6-phosphate 1-dehydrogenase
MNQKRSASAAAPAGPCCFVIFGASGDLTPPPPARVVQSCCGGLLPEAFSIIGIARGEKSNDAFRSDLAKSLWRSRGLQCRIIRIR